MMLLKETGLKTLAVSGGVAANSRLKERLKEECDKEGIQFYHPPVILCTDNAAMIAMAGYLNYKNGVVDDNFMKVYPNLEL